MASPSRVDSFFEEEQVPPIRRRGWLYLVTGVTMLRIIGVIPVLWLIAERRFGWAAVLGTAVALTDYIDGRLARSKRCTSRVGAWLDSSSDKILILSVTMLLAQETDSVILPWMAWTIAVREFMLTGARGWVEFRGARLPPDLFGKAKMWAQSTACIAVLWSLASPALFEGWGQTCLRGLVHATVILTVGSGAHYLWKARGLLKLSRSP